MFAHSKFNRDISRWNVSNVKDMSYIFYNSSFAGDIRKWNIRLDCATGFMFDGCPVKDKFKIVL